MGIAIRALFQPTFAFGQNIQVQSSITPACGLWTIYRLEYFWKARPRTADGSATSWRIRLGRW